MNKKTVVIVHPDYQKRWQDAADRAFIFLTAASILWFVINFHFYVVWPEGEPVREETLRFKDIMNTAMYLIPETLAGLGIANLFLMFWYSILLPVFNMADYGLSILFRKITRRGKSHE
ncbi:hypothetical protein ACGTI2_20955 (plasmid) [Morganella morganii]|uniref:hypothetical protein n=1 Tax=Morganella morganii TaxID=582 RepID=UPI0038701EE9